MIDLKYVTRLADCLSPRQKQSLIDHLTRRLQEAAEGVPPGAAEAVVEPDTLRGIWRGRFPDDFDIDAALDEIRHEWERELDEVSESGEVLDRTPVEVMEQRYRVEWAGEPRPWAQPSLVHVLRSEEVIGSYARNYPQLFHSFYPFVQGGKEYALYSPEYTTTRVMTLPDCCDLCSEEPTSNGFCPVDYHVPYEPRLGLGGEFGFVAGAVWGDDRSWKVQFLDLSQIDQGILRREERFGYLHLPEGIRLKDAVLLDWADQEDPDDPTVGLVVVNAFKLNTGQKAAW